jgi:hypothetical protein
MIKKFQKGLSKHTPEILMGIGITGLVTSTVLAVRATPKALELIEKKKEELQVDKLTAEDTVKATWKCYIPAAATSISSIACIIGANTVHARRNAMLATAYKLSEKAFIEYKDKVVEAIGEKQEKVIKEKIAQDRIDNNPVSKSEVIITEKGNTLCYEELSGRYFRSDIGKIKASINDLNRRMLSEMYISLNDLYSELGLECTQLGRLLGWNIDKGYIKPIFSAHLADDGTACVSLDFEEAPQYDFDKIL